MFIKENFVGPSYQNFRATDRIKSHFKIDKKNKYEIKIDFEKFLPFLDKINITESDILNQTFDKIKENLD